MNGRTAGSSEGMWRGRRAAVVGGLAVVAVLAAGLGAAVAAPADPPEEFAIFAENLVHFSDHLFVKASPCGKGGQVGSNKVVELAAGSHNIAMLVTGGGTLLAAKNGVYGDSIIFDGDATVGGSVHIVGNVEGGGNVVFGTTGHVEGNVIAKGDVNVGGSTHIDGNLDAGGSVKLGANAVIGGNVTSEGTGFGIDGDGVNVKIGGSAHVEGNVLAEGDVHTQGSGTKKVDGNLGTNGDVNIANYTTVGGTVTYGGTYTAGTINVSIGGGPNPGGVGPVVAAEPTPYVPQDLWAPVLFTAGGDDKTLAHPDTELHLAPGSYGKLDIKPTGRDLYLSSGTYRFTEMALGGGTNLFLHIKKDNPLAILSEGAVGIGTNLAVFVWDDVGGGYVNVQDIRNPANTQYHHLCELAKWSYAQTDYKTQPTPDPKDEEKAWNLGGGGQWFGTIYAPAGKIGVGRNGDMIGALYSGTSIWGDNHVAVDFVPLDENNELFENGEENVPEPAGIVLVGLGLLGVAARRRRVTRRVK